MINNIADVVQKYPKLDFLLSPQFQSLPPEKQKFLLDCVEDATFWIDLEGERHVTDGFKFLAAAYGLSQAEQQANEQGLQGKERSEFLRPIEELYTQFNPHFGTDAPVE